MNRDLVRALLSDVRAQWESGVRLLTTVQSSLEDPFSRDLEHRIEALEEHTQTLTEINATVRRLLEQVERAVK
jgi:hypothetical protein